MNAIPAPGPINVIRMDLMDERKSERACANTHAQLIARWRMASRKWYAALSK